MNLELILLIGGLCVFSLVIGIVLTAKLMPNFLKSVFRDTAKETLDEVTKEVTDSQDEYEEDITKKLKDLDKTLTEAKTVWQTSTETLTKEVSDLSRSHIQWAEALSNPGEQGTLAEQALEVMLEAAGLVKGVNFDTQITENTDQGRLRPDFYVYTPDNGVIVIDSKAPMKIYRDAIEIEDESLRKTKLLEHAKTMLAHARALSSKDYTQAVGRKSPDNVIMFVPNIAIYMSACEQLPDLIQQAWKHKVTICPPEAVYPILKNVMLSWQQMKLHENAENIQKQAIEIHSRLKRFQTYFNKIGKGINSAAEEFNKAAASWQSRLNPSIRKIEQMGIADPSREVSDVDLIENRVNKTGSDS